MLNGDLRYSGFEKKASEGGNKYVMARFIIGNSGESVGIMSKLPAEKFEILQPFEVYPVQFGLSAYKGFCQLEVVGIG